MMPRNASTSLPSISTDTVLDIVRAFETVEWHNVSLQPLPSVKDEHQDGKISQTELMMLGKELLISISRVYAQYINENDTEGYWLRHTAQDPFIEKSKDGKEKESTLSDVMDARALLLKQNCLINWKLLSELITTAKHKSIRIQTKSLEVLRALFLEILPLRKLKYIHQTDYDRLNFLTTTLGKWKSKESSWDVLEKSCRNLLLAITFEDFLKSAYSTFIQLLKDLLVGGLDFHQKRIPTYLLDLITQKPEQESILLDIMISRLFDKGNKIASQAAVHLNQLISVHGAMKLIIVRRIGKQILQSLSKLNNSLKPTNQKFKTKKQRMKSGNGFAPNAIVIMKGIYRGFIFISQLQFTRKEKNVASQALKCYLATLPSIFTFPDETGNKFVKPFYEHEEGSRIIRCLSTGVKRCIFVLNNYSKDGFSISDLEGADGVNVLNDNLTALYRAAHRPKSLSTNIALLSLLSDITPTQDRFYNLVYERIVDARLFDACNKFVLLTLLDRITESDSNISRIASFVKRLIQVSYFINGPEVTIEIAKMCHKRVQKGAKFRKILDYDPTAAPTEPYAHDKRNPAYTMADKCYLWDHHLNAASYHPLLAFEYAHFRHKHHPGIEHQTYDPQTLYEEVGAFSGILEAGKYAYTTGKYWSMGREAKPHQVLFKLFYHYKAHCQASSAKEVEDSYEVDSVISHEDEVASSPSVSASEMDTDFEDDVVGETIQEDADEEQADGFKSAGAEEDGVDGGSVGDGDADEDSDDDGDDINSESEQPRKAKLSTNYKHELNLIKHDLRDDIDYVQEAPAPKRIRKLIKDATKGSFADASSIEDLEKYL